MTAFPVLVFRSPGEWAGPPVNGKSSSYATLAATDEAALRVALRGGWYATLPEAVGLVPRVEGESAAPKVDPYDLPDDAPPTRSELKQKAAELGLKHAPNISDAKLAALIEEALRASASAPKVDPEAEPEPEAASAGRVVEGEQATADQEE